MYSGTISMQAKPRRRVVSLLAIRPDYEKFTKWTINEAADWSGLSPFTVRDSLAAEKFLRGNVKGPYRVDQETFKMYIEFGRTLRRRKRRGEK